MLVIQIFASGVTAQAVRVTVNTEECPENMGIGCRTFGFVMCGLIIAYECLTISMVLHFHLKFRALCWTSVTAPTEVNKVSDPLFRLVSRIRVLLLRKSYKYRIMDRPRGAFKKPKDLAKEPVRTERSAGAALADRPLKRCGHARRHRLRAHGSLRRQLARRLHVRDGAARREPHHCEPEWRWQRARPGQPWRGRRPRDGRAVRAVAVVIYVWAFAPSARPRHEHPDHLPV